MAGSRLTNIYQTIKQACADQARDPERVKLLAVSKYHPSTEILALYQQGQRIFGENYLSEAMEKIPQLPGDIEWHFIGPIQANKCKPIAQHFTWVQSVDRSKILQRLNRFRAGLPPMNICLQVNISEEETKSGCDLSTLSTLAEEAQQLPNLRLRGMMAIPSNTGDERVLKDQFMQLQSQFSALCQRYSTVDTLSMGMSGDYPLALAYGSTMIRVGTALFGPRN